jgi:predicted nuclease of predicted toxin-antitoxin system
VRLKLDENLATRLVPVLSGFGHDVDTVVQEGLGGRNDHDLWPEVQKADRFLITKDLGFSDERQYPPGTHQGIMVLRLSDDRSRSVAERLASVFGTEPVEAWTRCLVIVSDHKVRVRRPRPTQPTPTD